MLGIVFVRRLRKGKTYDDFRRAWYPEVGYGTPARIISGPGVLDPGQVVTVGYIDADIADLAMLGDRLAAAEANRHDKIAGVVESTEIRLVFEVAGDDDFGDAPHPMAPGQRGYPWTAPA